MKSYAQGGQYGNYHINLPIKTEINEDLRAAGDFAKQMELSQHYREKWANSYLSKLNNKSSIERQNRDDNFEFLQKNFKAIYEGEQREFEGRLAELKREQAEAANADPGFFDDLLPSLIKLAPKIMGMVAAGQAAHQAEQQQLATDVITKTGITPAQLGAQQRFQALPEGVISSSEKAQVFEAFHRHHASKVSAGDLRKVLEMTGENQMHSQLVAWRNDLPRVANQLKKISAVGSGERFDASLPIWRGQQAKYIQEFQKYSQEVVSDSFPFPDQNYYSDTVNFGIVQKSVRSIQNGIFNKNSNVWETIAAGHNKQHITNQLDTALGLGEQAILAHFDSRVEHFSKDPNLTPQEARLEAVNEFSANWLKGSGTKQDFDIFRQALDAQKAAVFNEKNGTTGQRIPRGGPVDDALDRMGLAIQNRDNQIQGVHNTTLRNQQKKDLQNFQTEYRNILDTEGPIAAADFLKQAQGTDFSDHPDLAKWINGMASHSAVLQPYVKPTFAQQYGISPADLDRAATDVAIGGLPTTAANNALGAAKLAKLNGNRIAIDKIKAHMKANWSAYERKYAGIYTPGSEEFLQQAAFDSHKAMTDGGALPITNAHASDPTAVAAYNFQVGTINITNRTADYNRLTKQKPKEYHSLYPTDKQTFENYGKAVQQVIKMGGDMNTPAQIQARVNLHNMPAVIERAATLDITKDEALDQILENLGYPDAIQNPFTEADRNTNSQILNRLHSNHKLTTSQGRQAALAAKHNQLQTPSHLLPVSNIPNSARTDTTGFRTYNTNNIPPETLALQDTIKFAEGTWGSDGYNTWAGFQKPKGYPANFGIRTIDDMHNWQTRFMNEGYTAMTGSAVMGAYQYKFAKRFAKQAGLDPSTALFNDENQDLMAQAALNNLGVTAQGLRNNGLTDEYIDKLAPTWASFPNLIGPDHYGRVGTNTSYYGQGGKTKQALKQFYLQRLNIYNKRGGGVPQKFWGII